MQLCVTVFLCFESTADPKSSSSRKSIDGSSHHGDEGSSKHIKQELKEFQQNFRVRMLGSLCAKNVPFQAPAPLRLVLSPGLHQHMCALAKTADVL